VEIVQKEIKYHFRILPKGVQVPGRRTRERNTEI